MEFLEDIENYMIENNLEFDSIDLGDNELPDIKTNTSLMAEFYIKYFNKFSSVLRECDIKEVRIILHNKDIFVNLVRLSAFKNRTSKFGRSKFEKELDDYVISKYDDIVLLLDIVDKITQ